jgi:NTP pyrophosphatase (non-canonical NTP hydrolase)
MMELSEISKINRARCERWHSGGENWNSSDWSNALGGESGELALAGLETLQAILTLAGKAGILQNTVKKVRRHETSVDRIATGRSYNTPELSVLLSRVKDEIADVFLYLDLVANHFDLELEECIFPKFNRVSKTQGFPERLGND